MTHPDPIHDAARLQEIAELGLLSLDVDPILADVAARAAGQLKLPLSVVSIVLDEAQHVAASYGLDGWIELTRGVPIEWSFCATSVGTREAFIVEDATVHPKQRTNPMVTLEGVRCYAGVPLISSRGFVLGNLCVVGREKRTFSEGELAMLHTLAAEAVRRIEERRQR
jgi:GAF domain-containing protein